MHNSNIRSIILVLRGWLLSHVLISLQFKKCKKKRVDYARAIVKLSKVCVATKF